MNASSRSIGAGVLCVGAVLAGAHTPAGAQQVLHTAEGRVDVVGLRRWTPAMLTDSIQRYEPGVSLFQTVECTKAITSKLRFPGVYFQKTIVGQPGDQAESVILFVVEREDAARLRWKPTPTRVAPPAPRWAGLRRMFDTTSTRYWSQGSVTQSLEGYATFRARGAASGMQSAARNGLDTIQAMRFWQALAQHAEPSDKALAFTTLRTDGHEQNRLFAVAVLTNFAGDDDAW